MSQEAKVFELRDRGTCIPLCAVRVDPRAGGYNSRPVRVLRRGGWDTDGGVYIFALADPARGCLVLGEAAHPAASEV